MPPRAAPRKTAKSAAPADLDGKQPANADGGDLDTLRAEVAAETGSADGIEYFGVPLAGSTVRVKADMLDWPASASSYFARGLVTEWAQQIIHADDFAQVWLAVNPTNRQVAEFVVAWEKISGLPLARPLISLGN